MSQARSVSERTVIEACAKTTLAKASDSNETSPFHRAQVMPKRHPGAAPSSPKLHRVTLAVRETFRRRLHAERSTIDERSGSEAAAPFTLCVMSALDDASAPLALRFNDVRNRGVGEWLDSSRDQRQLRFEVWLVSSTHPELDVWPSSSPGGLAASRHVGASPTEAHLTARRFRCREGCQASALA